MKQWKVHELLGFVFVWHHAEGEEPSWSIEDIPEVTNGRWKIFDRFEEAISCHIRDLMENAFDAAHAQVLHAANPFLSPGKIFETGSDTLWARFMTSHWTVENRIEGHVSFAEIDAPVSILGKRINLLHAHVTSQSVGPALMLERVRSKFGGALAVFAVFPEESLQVRVVQRLYFEPGTSWLFRWVLAKAQHSQVGKILLNLDG